MEGITLYNALLLCIYMLVQTYPVASGRGSVFLRFVTYENPQGNGANGHCCDGKWGICQSNGCDHKFTICFDQYLGPDSASSCEYARFQSGSTKNENNIVFGDSFGDVDNPMRVDFLSTNMPDALRLKIDVYDYDAGFTDSDFVDYMSDQIALSLLSPDVTLVLEMQNRTNLQAELWLECSQDWYGEACDVMCTQPTSSQHYDCDTFTGQMYCHDGWQGDDCSQEDLCYNMPCEHGSQCVVPVSYLSIAACLCSDAYTGQHCQFEVTTTPAPTTTTTPAPTTTTTPAPTTTTTEPEVYSDCHDVFTALGPEFEPGVYEITPAGQPAIEAWCSASTITVGNSAMPYGLTSLQRRASTSEADADFNQGWAAYKAGFGTPDGASGYWIGLDNIYWLTNQKQYSLNISMQLPSETWVYQSYDDFYIDSEADNYTLHVAHSSGVAGDALQYESLDGKRFHNGMPFSTPDNDHDNWADGSCAQLYVSGWWFNDCFWSNLNGRHWDWTKEWPSCEGDGQCIAWLSLPQPYTTFSLLQVHMDIIPKHMESEWF